MSLDDTIPKPLDTVQIAPLPATMGEQAVHSDGGMRDRILLPAKQMYKCEKLAPAQIPLVRADMQSHVPSGHVMALAGTWAEAVTRFPRRQDARRKRREYGCDTRQRDCGVEVNDCMSAGGGKSVVIDEWRWPPGCADAEFAGLLAREDLKPGLYLSSR